MEKLRLRLIVAIAVLLVGGLLNAAVRRPNPDAFDEKWMEQHLPRTIDGWGFIPSRENPEQSYVSSPQTYEMLKPFGIVARVYEVDGVRYDAMVIASDNPDSFHDPLVCQSGKIVSSKVESVETRTRGRTPFFVSKTDFDGRPGWMVWTYQGPRGMRADVISLTTDMFLSELQTGRLGSATFFRVLSIGPKIAKDEVVRFAVRYIDLTWETAGGKL